ncbi:hypothetical protein MNBD_GAMMA12-1120 [hydrothermal vent metagenome]|uniref:Hemerythrin-like domain-containing protein n=1 Tax=hydrothermal vent metagenome TaxID=652676 RepID=A0A3B0YC29_9ZZZZ
MISIDEPGQTSLAPDFTDPLGLLKACHTRILSHCDLLEKIMRYLDEQEMDQQVTDASRRVHRYFSTAGKLHHMDEEQDIFPRLSPISIALADTIDTLQQDHIAIEGLWDKISPALNNPHTITAQQLPILTTISTKFCTLIRKHIQLEEQELLPIAIQSISDSELEIIGDSMKYRRNLPT